PARSLCFDRAEANYDVAVDSVCCGHNRCLWTVCRCVSVCLTRRSHVAICDRPRLLHVGLASRACTRSGRAEMACPGGAPAGAPDRALPDRPLEALLQRGALPSVHPRGGPRPPALGRDFAPSRGPRYTAPPPRGAWHTRPSCSVYPRPARYPRAPHHLPRCCPLLFVPPPPLPT